MHIIADSGSTSVDWRLVSQNGAVGEVQTPGFNPVYQSENQLIEILRPVIDAALSGVASGRDGGPLKVSFFGAGVVSSEAAATVRVLLERVFGSADVYVGSDLEAAAISLHYGRDGLAAILGTGSNSGLYISGKIVSGVPAGGFILGDEGSGAWIGKALLSDFIKGLLPGELEVSLREMFPDLDYPHIVSEVYGGQMPSRYLASFSTFVASHRGCPWVEDTVLKGFRLFFERNIRSYARADLPLGFVGSVAVAYRDILDKVAVEYGYGSVTVQASAVDGLVRNIGRL